MSLRRVLTVLTVLTVLLAPGIARATDAFVSPTGSGVACTSGSPCATILAASSVVTAGGTMWVAPGYYQMANFTSTMSGTIGNPITVKCQASSTSTYVRGGCVMAPAPGSGTTGTWWAIDGTGYLVIDGLQLDGRGQDGSTWLTGIFGDTITGSGYITFQNNIVHHLAVLPTNVCSSNGGAALDVSSFASATNVMNAYNNVVHDIGAWASGCSTIQGIYLAAAGGGVVANNIVYNVAGYCIQEYHDASNYTIVNNTVSKCVTGGIIISAAQWYLGSSGNDVGGAGANGGVITNAQTLTSSNVLHFAANATGLSVIQAGWGWFTISGPDCGNAGTGTNNSTVSSVNAAAGTVTLSANICATMPSSTEVLFGPPSDHNYVAYNIAYDTPIGIYEWGATGVSNTYVRNLTAINSTAGLKLQNGLVATNEVTSDPQFVDYISGGLVNDYRLASGSPARGAAAATNAQATDFFGNTRPQGTAYDIGAVQYISPSPYFSSGAGTIGTSNSATPSQLNIVGNQNGIENTGGQIHLHSPSGTFFDKWIRLNDSTGGLEITNNNGNPIFALDDSGSARLGQFANSHGNTGATCNATNGLPTLNGSGLAQTCRYIFVGSGTSGAVRLTTDGSAASSHNCANVPLNSSGTWTVQVIATDIDTRGRDYSWTMPNGIYFRDAGNVSITTGTAITALTRGTLTGVAMAITADTTNQCFNLTWTHPSSDAHLYNVSAYLDVAEVSP